MHQSGLEPSRRLGATPLFLALNESETSIHADLLEPLARMIVKASRWSQVLVTTHSEALARSIEAGSGIAPVVLEKVDGGTRVRRSQP